MLVGLDNPSSRAILIRDHRPACWISRPRCGWLLLPGCSARQVFLLDKTPSSTWVSDNTNGRALAGSAGATHCEDAMAAQRCATLIKREPKHLLLVVPCKAAEGSTLHISALFVSLRASGNHALTIHDSLLSFNRRSPFLTTH